MITPIIIHLVIEIILHPGQLKALSFDGTSIINFLKISTIIYERLNDAIHLVAQAGKGAVT